LHGTYMPADLIFLHFIILILPNVVVEWLILLLRILEFPASNVETGYPGGFPQSLQSWDNTKIRPRPLPFTSFPIYLLLITPSFSTM
jgi:hypothetical protein